MIIRIARNAVRLSVALLLLVGFTVGTSRGEEFKVVVPNALTNVEGDESSCKVSESCVGIGFRAQIVYPAAEFTALPQTDLVITGWYFRPDHAATPRSGELGDLLLRFSTTDKGPGELSTVYANNVGEDVLTVYDGPLTLATQAAGPAAGPKDFDYYYPLETPFRYDPTTGKNLLADMVTESGYSFVALHDAYTSDPPRSVFSHNNPTAASGSPFNLIPVVQYVFEPVSPADFNLDLAVNHEDLAIWEGGYGSPGLRENGDANGDEIVTGADYLVWQREYVTAVPGLAVELSIPEPDAILLVLAGIVGGTAVQSRRSFKCPVYIESECYDQ